MVAEEQRLTDKQLELEDTDLEKLNQKLNLISDVIADGHHPTVTITYFVLDEHKAGGAYVEVTDAVKRVDLTARKIVLMRTEGYGKINKAIDFDRIIDIHGDLVDYMDDIME